MAADSTPLMLPPPAGEPGPAPSTPLSRRQLLVRAAIGGAALVTTNAASVVVTRRVSEAVTDQQIRDLQTDVRHLKQQLALYHDLERIGLDHLIAAALDLYDRLWPPIRGGLKALTGGLDLAETALGAFESGLASLRTAAQTVRDAIARVDAMTEGVQQIVNDILKRVSPLGEAVSGFLSWLVSRIPFGVGATVLEAASRVSALANAVPPLVSDTRDRLLDPLDQEWLATADGQGLQGRFFDPLRQSLLAPLRAHLEEVDHAAGNWDDEVARPLRTALAERERIRTEIGKLEKA